MAKRYNSNDPINILHAELSKVQKSLISGEMSHADLSNWFLEFCDKIGCEADNLIDQNEIELEEDELVVRTESKEIEKSYKCGDINCGRIFHCNENGEHSVGAITSIKQTPLKLIMNKLKSGYALFKSTDGWYTILEDMKNDLEKVNPKTV